MGLKINFVGIWRLWTKLIASWFERFILEILIMLIVLKFGVFMFLVLSIFTHELNKVGEATANHVFSLISWEHQRPQLLQLSQMN